MSTRKELAKMAAKAAAIATYNSIMGVTKTASTPDPDENNVRALAQSFEAKNIAEFLGSQGRYGNVQEAKTEKPILLAKIEETYGADFASKVGAILTGKGI